MSSSAESPNTRTHRIVLDSRDRDRTAHPRPSKYEVDLEDDLRDVVSVRLVAADVPFSSYTLPSGDPASARTLTLQTPLVGGGDPTPVVFRAGVYESGAAVAAELSFQLGTIAPPILYGVAWDAREDAIYVFVDGAFALTCDPAAAPRLARLLGMGPTVPTRPLVVQGATDVATAQSGVHNTAGLAYGLRMPFRVDVRGERYIALDLTPTAELLTSTNDPVNRTFAILPKSSSDTNIAWPEGAAVEKSWSTPLARISRLGVEFLDYYGTEYDFQNQDHRIEVVFRCLAQNQTARMYASMPRNWGGQPSTQQDRPPPQGVYISSPFG
jgi:hypothetical protein